MAAEKARKGFTVTSLGQPRAICITIGLPCRPGTHTLMFIAAGHPTYLLINGLRPMGQQLSRKGGSK